MTFKLYSEKQGGTSNVKSREGCSSSRNSWVKSLRLASLCSDERSKAIYGCVLKMVWLRRLRVCLQCRRPGFDPWVWKILWRRKWQLTPVLLPGKSQGWRSLAGQRSLAGTVQGFTKSQTQLRDFTFTFTAAEVSQSQII